jgi:hypothetical protein
MPALAGVINPSATFLPGAPSTPVFGRNVRPFRSPAPQARPVPDMRIRRSMYDHAARSRGELRTPAGQLDQHGINPARLPALPMAERNPVRGKQAARCRFREKLTPLSEPRLSFGIRWRTVHG